MGGSERGKFVPQQYIRQLAKDTIGIGAGQRFKERHQKDPDRTGVNINAVVVGFDQFVAPIIERFIEGHPIIEKHLQVANIVFLLDLGIDAVAILLAVNGHIGEGIVTKTAYNMSANAFLNATSRESPMPPNGIK